MIKTKSSPYGQHIIEEKFEILFGNRNFQKENWQKAFPGKEFISLHQAHSDACIEAKPGSEIKADAHYSYEKNRALIIKTADCVPLFFYCPTTDTCLGVHAGWRGLKDGIIPKSLLKAFPYSSKEKLQCFIGPHIHWKNYEFGEDDIKKITPLFPFSFYHKNNNKYYLDLQSIYLNQLEKEKLSPDNIHLYNTCTFDSTEHFSYRKNSTKDRLYHLIFRKA